MPEIRKVSEYYEKIAQELIEDEPALESIKEYAPMIIYLESDYEKKTHGKTVLGLCEKVPSKNKWSIPADFTITIYTENLNKANFTKYQERIVVLHELLHVGIDKKGMYVKPHDLEDFRTIINEYGAYWDNASEVSE